jgi:hypothetical protein
MMPYWLGLAECTGALLAWPYLLEYTSAAPVGQGSPGLARSGAANVDQCGICSMIDLNEAHPAPSAACLQL